MKTIKAEKCKDGWLLTITERWAVGCEADVLKVIGENGLKVNKQCSHKPTKENPQEWIYAE